MWSPHWLSVPRTAAAAAAPSSQSCGPDTRRTGGCLFEKRFVVYSNIRIFKYTRRQIFKYLNIQIFGLPIFWHQNCIFNDRTILIFRKIFDCKPLNSLNKIIFLKKIFYPMNSMGYGPGLNGFFRQFMIK